MSPPRASSLAIAPNAHIGLLLRFDDKAIDAASKALPSANARRLIDRTSSFRRTTFPVTERLATRSIYLAHVLNIAEWLQADEDREAIFG
jgi:hypothetical protein